MRTMSALKMKISEVKEKYNKSHFGNEKIEIGTVVWIRESGQEYPVEVIAD